MIRDMGGMCVFSVCVVSVLSVPSVCVCECVCVCVCIFHRYSNRANTSSLFTPYAKNTLHIKIYTQHKYPTLQHYRAVSSYQPAHKKITFGFLLLFSEFYFLFSAIPTGFLIFCLPHDEPTGKSVTNTLPQNRRSKQP